MRYYFILVLLVFAGCGDAAHKEVRKFVRPPETAPAAKYYLNFAENITDAVLMPGNSISVLYGKEPSICVSNYTADGKMVWTHDISIQGDTLSPACLGLTKDGNIIVGYTCGFGQRIRAYMTRLDATGRELFRQKMNSDQVDKIVTDDGGTVTVLCNTSGIRLMRIKGDSTVEWDNYFGESSVYVTRNIFRLPGNAILLTNEFEIGKGIEFSYIDANGQLKWKQHYRFDHEGDQKAIAITTDAAGNIYAYGQCADTILKEGVLFMKLSVAGELLAHKSHFWEDDAALSRAGFFAPDGRFYMAGQMQNFKVPYRNFICCGDTTGNLVWARTLRQENNRSGFDEVFYLSGRLYALGYWDSVGEGRNKGDGNYISVIPTDGGKGVVADY